jgi:hypothetical protein
MMVALARVELATFGLGNRCSIHLSYRAVWHKQQIVSSVYNNRLPGLRRVNSTGAGNRSSSFRL